MEVVLGDAHVLLRLGVLSNDGVHYGLQDVLLGQDAVHVLDQLVGLVDLIGLEVVNHQIESGFGDHVEERRQNLKCVFASPENYQIMSKQIIVLKNVTHGRGVLEGLEFGLSGLTIVELVVVAGFEVHAHN